MSFLSELKRRNVFRVGAAYLVTAWLLVQIAETIFPLFGFDDTPARIVVLLSAVGFIPALVLAWIYEFTSKGLRRDEDVDRTEQSAITSGRKFDFAIICILTVAVGLLGYRQFIDQPLYPDVGNLPQDVTSPEAGSRSIAVLKFANFGADSSFSDGLSEQLLYSLARVSELSVPSRQATWALSGGDADHEDVAESLRVRFLLDGSIQQHDEHIRVTARLIEGLSGSQVWSETYEETLSAENFFSIQDSIARQVVNRLGVTLGAETNRELIPGGTTNNDALRFYLVGRQELAKPKTDGSLTAAISAFDSAVEADPHFAQAFAGLCEANLAMFVTYRAVRYFDSAEAACVRGLRIDRHNGEVHAALGSLYRYGGQYDEAEKDLTEARRLLNGPAHVLEELGRTYRSQGKLILAEQTFNEAIKKDPANWSVYKSMANFLFRTGRFKAALPYYKQVVLMQPESAPAHTNIGAAFFMLGDFGNATIAWTHSLEIEATHLAYVNLGNSLYYQGRFDESATIYRMATELAPEDLRAWGSLAASCHFARGAQRCESDAFARAIGLARERLEIDPTDLQTSARLASYLARTNQDGEALQIISEIAMVSWDEPQVPYFVALAQIAVGDSKSAIDSLYRSVQLGNPLTLVYADPHFVNLTRTAEFKELVGSIAETH